MDELTSALSAVFDATGENIITGFDEEVIVRAVADGRRVPLKCLFFRFGYFPWDGLGVSAVQSKHGTLLRKENVSM